MGSRLDTVYRDHVRILIPRGLIKLNYRKKVFYFALNFLPWEFLLIKRLDFEKTKPSQYSTFKTDITKVDLVFSISNFFFNKNSHANK